MDEDLEKKADEYVKSMSIPDFGGDEDEVPKPAAAPSWAAPAGAAAGAVMGYKGINPLGVLRPRADLFAPRGGPIPVVPPEVSGTTGGTSGEKWSRNWANVERPGVGGVPEASAAYQRSKGHGKVSERMSKMWGPVPSGTSLAEHLASKSAAAEADVAAQAAARQMAERQAARAQILGRLGGIAGGVAKVGVPAAGGAMAGKELYEAVQDYMNRGMSLDTALKMASGVGGLAMMVPNPLVAGLGLAAQVPHAIRGLQQNLQAMSPEEREQMNADIRASMPTP